MNLKELKVIDKIIKSSKIKHFRLTNHGIHGSADEGSSYVFITYPISINNEYELTLELWKHMITIIEEDSSITEETSLESYINLCSLVTIKKSSIIVMTETINNCLQNSIPSYHIEDVKKDPRFEETFALKSDSGQRMVLCDGFLITTYSGLLPVTSKDKVSLTCYDNIDENHRYFLAEFTINKGFCIIKKYCMYMHMR